MTCLLICWILINRNWRKEIYYYYCEKDTLEVDTGSDTNNGDYWEFCTFYFINFPRVLISTSFYQNLMRYSKLCTLVVHFIPVLCGDPIFSTSLHYMMQLPTWWCIMVMWVFPTRLICFSWEAQCIETLHIPIAIQDFLLLPELPPAITRNLP